MNNLIENAKNTFMNHCTIKVESDPRQFGKIIYVGLFQGNSSIGFSNKNRGLEMVVKTSDTEIMYTSSNIIEENVSVCVDTILDKAIERACLYNDLQKSFWKRLKFLFKKHV